MRKYIWFIFIFLLIGFIYRYIFSLFTQSEPVGDMFVFLDHGRRMLSGEIVSDCCAKNVGYGLFLAGIGLFGGINNLSVLIFVQILLDLFVALSVLFVSRSLFSLRISFLCFCLYIFNPFTPSFVGLRLPEISVLFIISCLSLLFINKGFVKHWWLWVFTGLFLGLLVFFRMAYYWFAIFLTFTFMLFLFQKFTRYLFIVCVLVGFFITSSYTLFANYRDFGKVSVIAHTNFMYPQIYLNFYGAKYAELLGELEEVDPRYMAVMTEYFSVPTTEIPNVNEKYKKKFFAEIVTQWPSYSINVSKNMFWIWDKYHLSVYTDPFYPQDMWILRILNLLLIVFSFFGFGTYVFKNRKNQIRQGVVLFTIVLFLYITLFFSLVSNESRHSIAFYGLLFVWAGFGLDSIGEFLKRRNL